ncbi:DUF7689 domain-containing protein [Laspinema olomoucense]|uniref:DUF7689 domain-containing protein n=1 Tax=Laspinema olomoucense D3b TaxID=2953688 RepID=A0ABT2N987_9CYAN|nr:MULTISPECIES: hypothetical protein [unclassified Laspinema]MCT7972148.1 hypothetical protein [Laspinema sp. D3d]MCT7978285.1 hypothetical protein [Laspinema sp. D3b]MCT7988375.1 hypothetical protein [Laspinema sp. D3a]MCT7993137.1 hypothetical protein [Laspinema sp. D3c]
MVENEPIGNSAWRAEVRGWIEADYPNLLESGYRLTSSDTIDYNCIAWALEDTSKWWWPDEMGQQYWPPPMKREESLEAFIQVFASFGYEVCETASVEVGFQKVALYADSNRTPTHAARQLDSGKWTSKLGSGEDIEHHELDGLVGEKYGQVAAILKKIIP